MNALVHISACLAVLFLVGCGGSSSSSSTGQPRRPYSHGSLTSPYVRPLLPRYSTEPGSLTGGVVGSVVKNPKEGKKMPRSSEELAASQMPSSGPCQGNGEHEAAKALQKSGAKVDWSPSDGLGELVRLAEKRRAYRVDGAPRDGDIVLFHNTRDANGDKQNNDWHSAAGIVLEVGRPFETQVCVHELSRRVRAWPNGPAVREYRGEVVNSFLRVPTHDDPPGTTYLSGSLYAGHIDIRRMVD